MRGSVESATIEPLRVTSVREKGDRLLCPQSQGLGSVRRGGCGQRGLSPFSRSLVNAGFDTRSRKRSQRGFTLLEVLVATAIMGVTVAGLLSALSASARNAGRLTGYDRATLLAKSKMDELIADQKAPRKVTLEGPFDPAQSGGVTAGWRATISPFETAPGAGPGMWVLDRIQLEVWWMEGPVRHALSLEGYRRGILRPGDI